MPVSLHEPCPACRKQVLTLDETLNPLRDSLKYAQRTLDKAQARIQQVEQFAHNWISHPSKVPEVIPKPDLTPTPPETIPPANLSIPKPSKEMAIPSLPPEPVKESSPKTVEDSPKSKVPVSPVSHTPKAASPSPLSIWLADFMKAWVGGPIGQLWSHLIMIWKHYSEKGQVPALLMTLGGVLTLLFGFGYLLQFTEGAIFESLRIGATLASATGLMWWGMRLSRGNLIFREFGAALMGLSISLNYLVCWFVSADAGGTLLPVSWAEPIGMLGIVLNTAWALWVAIRFETRIVAVVMLFGGSLTPYVLAQFQFGWFHGVYMILLTVGTLYLAQKIDWRPLAFLGWVSGAVLFDWAIWQDHVIAPLWIMILSLEVFAGLFIWFSMFQYGRPRTTLQRDDLFLICGSVAWLMLSLFGYVESQELLGGLYVLNAIGFLAIFGGLRSELPQKVQFLLFLLAGAFVGLAVPALVGASVMGGVWAAEGLALAAAGLLFALPNVRREGLVVATIGAGTLLWNSREILLKWSETLWHPGFAQFMVFGTVLMVAVGLFQKYRTEAKDWETKRLLPTLWEALNIWAVAAILLPLGFLFQEWGWLTGWLLGYGAIFWALKNGHRFTEKVGWGLLAIPLGLYVWGCIESESFRWMQLPHWAQLGSILTLFTCWHIQSFYQHTSPKPEATENARFFRALFFSLLPLIGLPSLFRRAPDFGALGLVAATALAMVLHARLRNQSWKWLLQALRIEQLLLTIAALVVIVISWLQFPPHWHESFLAGWQGGGTLLHVGFGNLLLLGGMLFAIHQWKLLDTWQQATVSLPKLPLYLFSAFKIWLTITIMVVGFFFLGPYAWLLGAGFLYIGTWWELTQKPSGTTLWLKAGRLILWAGLAWSLLWATTVSWHALSAPHLATRIVWLISLFGHFGFCRWLCGKQDHADTFQTTLHWMIGWFLVPLLVLTDWNLLMPTHFSVGLWISAIIAYAIKKTKLLEIHQFAVLELLATGALIWEQSLWGFALGLVWLPIRFIVGGHYHPVPHDKPAFRLALLYPGFVASAAFISEWVELSGAGWGIIMWLPTAWLACLLLFSRKLPQIQDRPILHLILAEWLMLIGLGMAALGNDFTSRSPSIIETVVLGFLALLSLVGLFVHLHRNEVLWQDNPQRKRAWHFHLVMTHILTILSYGLFLQLVDYGNVLLTLMLFLHGIIALFLSVRTPFEFLLRMALAILLLAFLKLFLLDFRDLALPLKVGLGMGTGVMMIIGARVFLSFRKRLDQSEGDSTSTSED
ncbi:hypothetical protein [Pontibacter sp. G13]|uniref:hypothetical protein n=1 Tax=Pontibacter sp. G13 TaxID=3074898 RepID=UPI00288C177A|nr:hypothetical protein [Pontibacter sp. G13]WNJ17856.1 hypothetical protein RJD25_23635 [Pontibacter sp. G13]